MWILAGVIWAIISMIVGIIFVITYLSLCSLQTITKRFYIGMVICYLIRNVFLALVLVPLVYDVQFLCVVMGTGVFTSSLGELLYMLSIAITLLIAKCRTRKVDSTVPVTCNPFQTRVIQYEVYVHAIVIILSAGYGTTCAFFVGEVNDEICFIDNFIARILLEVVVSASILILTFIFICATWALATCFKKTENILDEDRITAGCLSCGREMRIHYVKELVVITLILIAQVLEYCLTYMILITPVWEEFFYFAYFIAQNFPVWVLFCCYILCNCFTLRVCLSGNCCCMKVSFKKGINVKGDTYQTVPLDVLKSYE